MEEKMKLQKFMSTAGICSRRKAEDYIRNGEVYVNREIAHIGQVIDSKKDNVTLAHSAKFSQKSYVYYKYNKPRGIESTCAQKNGQSIVDVVDIPERIFPVGRLDKESTGLIILTNDGRMTNYLTHPRYGHEKEYIVEVFGPIDDASLQTMSRGVKILGEWTKSCDIKRKAAGKFSIILTEGKNRQIRRMVESVGYRVKKLKRIRIENIFLEGLRQGEYKMISGAEKKCLFEKLGISIS